MIKFIKWWWNRSDHFQRSLCIMISAFILTFAFLPIVGPGVLFFLLGVMIGIAGYQLFRLISAEIRQQWAVYKHEHPTEDERIMRRLRGTDIAKKSDV